MILTDEDRAAIMQAQIDCRPDFQPSIDAAIFFAGIRAGMERAAKIADEGMPGQGQDEGYKIICPCARRIREAAK